MQPDGKPLACCKGLDFYRHASIMDFSRSTGTTLYTLVVKINNVTFNFILSGRDFQKREVPQINIKTELVEA